MLTVSDSCLDQIFGVNVLAPVALTRDLFGNLLSDTTEARLIFVGSVAGDVAWPWVGAYAATKHALEGNELNAIC